MNEPIDHHYLPIFYLSRWVGGDGRVCRFNRPTGTEVKARRVVPKGTAFEPRLYEVKGAPPERAQAMEANFLKQLDTEAANALGLLERGLPESEWTSGPRSSWSRFLLAQMLRSPEDIAQLKSSVKEEWQKAIPELGSAYEKGRSDSDPPTVAEYLQGLNPGGVDDFALSIARKLMNHPKICQIFNNMHWLVLEIPAEGISLLTSDRPVWMTATLTEEDAFVTMPIGPRRLFTATVHQETQSRLLAKRQIDLIKAVNKTTVQHAVKYVYGLGDRMLPFIQKYFATRRHSTLLERQASARGFKIVAPDNPYLKD